MKQMDRRLPILTRLRATRAVRAADLAEDCGCSVRTVYRDIDALFHAGIPIAALAGLGVNMPVANIVTIAAMAMSSASPKDVPTLVFIYSFSLLCVPEAKIASVTFLLLTFWTSLTFP